MCLEIHSLRIYSLRISNNLRRLSTFQDLTKLVQGNQLFHLETQIKTSSSPLDPQYRLQKPSRLIGRSSKTLMRPLIFSRVLPSQTILYQLSVIFSNLSQMLFSSLYKMPSLRLHNSRRHLLLTRFKISKNPHLARSSSPSLLNLDLLLPLLLVKLKLHLFRIFK